MTLEDLESVKQSVIRNFPLSAGISLSNVNINISTNVDTAAVFAEPNEKGELKVKKIEVNPNFFEKLSFGERVFVLAHEAYHISFKHFARARKKVEKDIEDAYKEYCKVETDENKRRIKKQMLTQKHQKIWNIATDACINAFLKKSGLPMPEGCVDMKDGMTRSAERIYDYLIQKEKDKEQAKNENSDDSKDKQQKNSSNNSQGEQQNSSSNSQGEQQSSSSNSQGEQQNSSGNSQGEQQSSSGNSQGEQQSGSSNSQDEQQNSSSNSQSRQQSGSSNSQNGQPSGSSNSQSEQQNNKSNSSTSSKKILDECIPGLDDIDIDDYSGFDSHEQWYAEETQNLNDAKDYEQSASDEEIDETQIMEKERISKQKKEKEKGSLKDSFKKIRESHGLKDFEDKKSIIPWKQLLVGQLEKKVEVWGNRRSSRFNPNARIEERDIEEKPDIEVILDVSGSISHDLLRGFLIQLHTLFESIVDDEGISLKVGFFEERFHSFQVIRNKADISTLKIPEGYGTNFEIAATSFTPDPGRKIVKIVFTDGILGYQQVTRVPDIIWIVFGNSMNFTPVGGRIIKVSLEEKNQMENTKFYIDEQEQSFRRK